VSRRTVPVAVCLLFIFLFTAVSIAFSHGGGIDSCGGHGDRKRGGYHVHNQVRYCACYPNLSGCAPKKESPIQTTTTFSKGVSPVSEWNCPEDHPIKGNINTRKGTMIYHLPGGTYYDKTKPEQCFATEEDAAGAGFRRSKL